MALGGVPDLAQLGLDGMGTQGLGTLGALGRGDEDEQKRRLQHVLDILQVRNDFPGVMQCLAKKCGFTGQQRQIERSRY